jgi:hypothetical protein
MDETKVELYAQLGEISVMLGKLTDEKKLKNVSKKVNNLHSLLKRKKNKTMKKRKRNKSVTFSDMSMSEPSMDDNLSMNNKPSMDDNLSMSNKPSMNNKTSMDDNLSMSNKPSMNFFDKSVDDESTDMSNNEPMSYISDSPMNIPKSIKNVTDPENSQYLPDPDKLSDPDNMNGGFSDSLTNRYG